MELAMRKCTYLCLSHRCNPYGGATEGGAAENTTLLCRAGGFPRSAFHRRRLTPCADTVGFFFFLVFSLFFLKLLFKKFVLCKKYYICPVIQLFDMANSKDVDLSISKIANNLRQGSRLDRHGERFLNYALDRLSELDSRSKRFVLCSLLHYALTNDPRYSRFYDQLKAGYELETGAKVNVPSGGLV